MTSTPISGAASSICACKVLFMTWLFGYRHTTQIVLHEVQVRLTSVVLAVVYYLVTKTLPSFASRSRIKKYNTLVL